MPDIAPPKPIKLYGVYDESGWVPQNQHTGERTFLAFENKKDAKQAAKFMKIVSSRPFYVAPIN